MTRPSLHSESPRGSPSLRGPAEGSGGTFRGHNGGLNHKSTALQEPKGPQAVRLASGEECRTPNPPSAKVQGCSKLTLKRTCHSTCHSPASSCVREVCNGSPTHLLCGEIQTSTQTGWCNNSKSAPRGPRFGNAASAVKKVMMRSYKNGYSCYTGGSHFGKKKNKKNYCPR